MKQIFYWTAVLFVFIALATGIDNYFGPEVKRFSMFLFIVWMVQVLTGNWNEIKAFIKRCLLK